MNIEELLNNPLVAYREDSNNHFDTAALFSSFANSQGGTVLFGVRENGKTKGVNPQDILDDFEYIISSYFDSPIEWESEQLIVGRHLLVAVCISKSNIKVSVKNGDSKEFYSRIDNSTVLSNKIILKVWSLKKGRSDLKELNDIEAEIVLIIKEHGILSLSMLYKSISGKNSSIDSGLAQLIYKEKVNLACENNELKYCITRFK